MEFPTNQLTKMVWGPIKSGAPEAYHIISKMNFTDMEYNNLIAGISEWDSDASKEWAACQWVQENKSKWMQWLPPGLMEKPKLYLAGLFPLSGRSWSQPGLVEGKLCLSWSEFEIF